MAIDSVTGAVAAIASQAAQRQQLATILAIKTQAQADQAVADIIAQATQQGQGTVQAFSTVPVRGSTLNILV